MEAAFIARGPPDPGSAMGQMEFCSPAALSSTAALPRASGSAIWLPPLPSPPGSASR